MAIGMRMYGAPRRPAREWIEAFRDVPVANIADNMNRLYCVDTAIKPMNRGRLLGCAYTVKAPAGDNLMIHKALHSAAPGDILVVDGGGYSGRALIGGIMLNQSATRGLGGWLIDGVVRDRDEVEASDMPLYARGYQPNGPYKNGPGEINVPVCVGGQVVLPGDIIVGDADGVVIIHPWDAVELARKARAQKEREANVLVDVHNGILDTEWIERFCADKQLEIIRERFDLEEWE